MSNLEHLLGTPAPQHGARTGRAQATSQAPGAILHNVQSHVTGLLAPLMGAHTAGISSGVNPVPEVSQATLYNPYLAISSWASPPSTGGTFPLVWSQSQPVVHSQAMAVNPQQVQNPTSTAQSCQQSIDAPGPSRAVEFLPLEERPILQVSLGSKRHSGDTRQDHRSKRTRYYESEDSDDGGMDEDLAEEFDPDSYYRTNKKSNLPEIIQKYVNTHFRTCLPKVVRKAMARENPLPDSPALRSPETDDVLVDYMGGDYPSITDAHYKRIQTAIISAGAPMLNLWAHLEEQQLTSSQGGLIQVEVMLEAIQKSLVLLGNASNYVSESRRDLIIGKLSRKKKSLSKVLKSACKKNKAEGSLLFGPAVHKAISYRADTLSAFSKAAEKTSLPQAGRSDGNFFRRGPTSRDGGRSGKFPKPFHSSGQRIYQPRDSQPRGRTEYHQYQPFKKPFKKGRFQNLNTQK